MTFKIGDKFTYGRYAEASCVLMKVQKHRMESKYTGQMDNLVCAVLIQTTGHYNDSLGYMTYMSDLEEVFLK